MHCPSIHLVFDPCHLSPDSRTQQYPPWSFLDGFDRLVFEYRPVAVDGFYTDHVFISFGHAGRAGE